MTTTKRETDSEILRRILNEPMMWLRYWQECLGREERKRAVEIAEGEVVSIVGGWCEEEGWDRGLRLENFVREMCEADPCARCRSRVMYEAYVMWLEVKGIDFGEERYLRRRSKRLEREGEEVGYVYFGKEVEVVSSWLSNREFNRQMEERGFVRRIDGGEARLMGLTLRPRERRVFGEMKRVYDLERLLVFSRDARLHGEMGPRMKWSANKEFSGIIFQG